MFSMEAKPQADMFTNIARNRLRRNAYPTIPQEGAAVERMNLQDVKIFNPVVVDLNETIPVPQRMSGPSTSTAVTSEMQDCVQDLTDKEMPPGLNELIISILAARVQTLVAAFYMSHTL